MHSAAMERIDQRTCCDIDDVARPLRRTGGDVHQLGHGALNGKQDQRQLRNAWIHRVTVNRVIHAFSHRAENHGFLLIVSDSEVTKFCGHRLSAGQICVNLPGDAWDILSGAWLRIELSCDLFNGAHAEQSARSKLDADTPRIVHPRASTFSKIMNQATRMLEFPCATIKERAEQELVALLRQALESTSRSCPQHPRSVLSHRRIVLEAHMYMVNHIAIPLTGGDVCKALDVSERTLRYAFHEAFELSPMAYFKLMRLNAVHREFKAHDRGTTTVHEVAQRFGFEHLGAFAADYRKLFGVYPSESLAPVRRSPIG